MIVYDLSCAGGHRFEGWFASSDDFEAQRDDDLLDCPVCGDRTIGQAPMAPAVGAKGNSIAASAGQGGEGPSPPIPEAVRAAMTALAKAQKAALANSRYVGDGFAENARAMHYGEQAVEAIHGKATVKQAKELLEEGVSVAPLPFPVAEPDELN